MPTSASRVVFRVDGNATIGLGHVVRCLALADMLQPGFDCVFAIQDMDVSGQQQIQPLCSAIWSVPVFEQPEQEAQWLLRQMRPTDILVLDGYHFGPAYAHIFWRQARPVVCLDDLLAQPLWADVVINHAGGVGPEAYADKVVPGAALCLGPQYALLRRVFQPAARQPVAAPDTDRIFLNMGGADPENHTLRLLRELRQRFPAKAIEVVTGAAYPHQTELATQAQSISRITLHHAISAEAMAALLRRCGIHVCPPSGVAYECCAVGGLLLLHPIADNQRLLLAYLTGAGLALPYSDLAAISETQLPCLAQQLQQRQWQVFDGKTGPRFREVFTALHAAYQLTVRRAEATDAHQYFTWANDPDVRRNAIQPELIAWSNHLDWFARRLVDADSFLYIFERAGTPVGQVRIEFTGSEGTIDYSVDSAFRGQGLGLAILRRALGQLRRDKPSAWALVGQVKAGNLPSCRVFQRLGFAQLAALRLHNETYEVFRLEVAPAVS
ncbi:UDP-2,4-diacetamido-2,4,6-trideoxy-beta-L-altropyranose hydrolase [Hymenobacter lucidus]|uniref:UDP-2,4-diacetamido-2,4, 6-trideoxy-beta-L-altropyranose hydrolase n=1 Tax=Hymenobacter lucidus TaxID=2880930 RepID=A0ABS8ANY2_9BACT|nr:UDP-2,4-diacetamido-2,4,6-trideoxy-beta-L-altropyranose hydrolase [Hymenobacter lucidus]MCB2407728.1 UDP-2,4-diacetamido-2,4,6-trideoxy-beta-L-altropyranose hydrolase [Hymenobacter lucidus]